MPQVSWSEVKLFRKCMKAHDYRYHQRLQKKKPNRSLVKGRILHEMLDAFIQSKRWKNYKGPDPWDVLAAYEEEYGRLFIEEQEEYGDMINDCTQLFENYVSHYRHDDLTYEESEVFVATDLTDDIRYIGYIDKIAIDGQGRRWAVDHKFVKNIPTAEDQFSELQLLMYVWAWNRFNPSKQIDGIIWDYARTKLPTKPEVLKSGGLSKRKNIDTTSEVYLQTIQENDLDPQDYVDMLELLEGKESQFFERVKLPRPSSAMIEQIVSDFRGTAIMIQRLKGVAPRSMNNFNCKTCEFKALCEAEVRGLDADFVRKSQYTKREQMRDEDYGNEES